MFVDHVEVNTSYRRNRVLQRTGSGKHIVLRRNYATAISTTVNFVETNEIRWELDFCFVLIAYREYYPRKHEKEKIPVRDSF